MESTHRPTGYSGGAKGVELEDQQIVPFHRWSAFPCHTSLALCTTYLSATPTGLSRSRDPAGCARICLVNGPIHSSTTSEVNLMSRWEQKIKNVAWRSGGTQRSREITRSPK